MINEHRNNSRSSNEKQTGKLSMAIKQIYWIFSTGILMHNTIQRKFTYDEWAEIAWHVQNTWPLVKFVMLLHGCFNPCQVNRIIQLLWNSRMNAFAMEPMDLDLFWCCSSNCCISRCKWWNRGKNALDKRVQNSSDQSTVACDIGWWSSRSGCRSRSRTLSSSLSYLGEKIHS